MTTRFARFELRTHDLDAARRFYADVMGPALWGADVVLSPMPPNVVARGAPPHWLGHLAADTVETGEHVEREAQRIVAAGGARLGPTLRAEDGTAFAVVRDPFETVLALCAPKARLRDGLVVWHQLHTRDHEGAFATYSSLFGWTARERFDLGPSGVHQTFAWSGGDAPAVGAIANTALLRGVHPHWLFYFAVPDLDAALDQVRAHRGTVVGALRTPSGDRIAPCDDPQGAAFGLYEARR